MEIHPLPGGGLLVEHIPAALVTILRTVPAILSGLDPYSEGPLFPRAFEDDEEEAQWKRYARPDLAHLFQTRLEVIAGDLAGMELQEDGCGPGEEESFRLVIPAGHEAAWLAGLNAVRLFIYTKLKFSPEEMKLEPQELEDPAKALALFEIQALAVFQQAILESTQG